MDIFVSSDVYSVGYGEDGEKHSEVFYVVAEADNGSRWAHMVSFQGARKVAVDDPEFPMPFYFKDIREEAKAAAEKLAERVRAHLAAGGKLDASRWGSIDPRYGSDAYASLDSGGYFKEREKREDQGI